MPPSTLSIGGATFDLFVQTDPSVIRPCADNRAFTLPLGDKLRIETVTGAFGGGAANSAVGFARLGCAAAFGGPMASDQWGQSIRRNLEQEGVSIAQATIVEDETSSFSLILSAESGERTILTHKGIDRFLGDPTFDLEAATAMDALYITSIHDDSREISDDIADLLGILPKIHLTWNPGGNQISAGMREPNAALLLPHVNLLLLNKEETMAFSGKRTVLEALHALVDAGVQYIAVTDGPRGVTATDGKQLYHCPALPCTVVDTTGAGDAFGTGATWAILSEKDLPDALRTGTINASSVVGAVGAQTGLLTASQMRQRLEQTDQTVRTEPF